jgi:hypothetical protein
MASDSISEKEWRDSLSRRIRDCKIEVIGHDDVKNFAQAKAVLGILAAFGDSPAGFVYIEPCTFRSSHKPADIVLCHPDVGLLIIEVKGYLTEQIERVQAGSLFIRTRGFVRGENHISQARDTMFDIKNAITRLLPDYHNEPLLNCMIAYPNISKTGWKHRGFDQCLPMQQILLKDNFDTPALGREHINHFVQEGMRQTNRKSPLTIEHLELIKKAFGDSASINVPAEERQADRKNAEPRLGNYIDELETSEKYLSREQEELSRLNVQGYPRLVRGVAGSGKTIVLANQVCRFIRRNISETGDLFKEKQHPLRVAAVCFNRALVPFINKKIRDTYKQQTLEGLPPNILSISHFEGFLWQLAEDPETTIPYIPYSADKTKRAKKHLWLLKT